MTSEEKKAFLLLKGIIFQYHGLDAEEEQLLQLTADELQAQTEYDWVKSFMAEDYLTAFERARDYFPSLNLTDELKLDMLYRVWRANQAKGYITEMEATGMLRLARDWKLEAQLLERVRGKVGA
jgi:hypothetical protein